MATPGGRPPLASNGGGAASLPRGALAGILRQMISHLQNRTGVAGRWRRLRLAAKALLALGLLAGCERETRLAPRPGPRAGGPSTVVDLDAFAPSTLRVGADGRWSVVEGHRTLDLLPRLRVDGPIEEISRTDTLAVSAVGQAGARLRAILPPFPPTSLSAVEFGYAGSSGGRVRLAWRGPDDEEFTRGLHYVTVEGGGRWQRIRLPFGAPFSANARVTEIALILPADEVGVIRVHDPALVLDDPTHRSPVSIDGQVRPVRAIPPDGALQWGLEVPSGAVLFFDHAIHPLAWSTRGDGTWFEVRVVDRGKAELAWSGWLDPYSDPTHRAWHAARVDLSPWAGREVQLRIAARSSAPARGVFEALANERGDEPLLAGVRVVGSEGEPANVLLIVIDTLRRDGLGIYGNERESSPRIDALARESTVFEHAWAPSSWTHPSTASFLSGWVPSRHGLGMGEPGTTQIDPRTPWLPEAFRRAGYATAAVSNNVIVSPDEGFARGFDSFDTRPFEADQIYGAQRVTRGALEWLDGHGDQPFFLYLHYFDPHDRYQAPPPLTRRFVDRAMSRAVDNLGILGGRPNPLREALEDPSKSIPVRPADLTYLRALYDAEVLYVDHWIGRLLDELEARGLLASTTVVLTSDHGEEFFEHGFLKHGHSLHEELVGVPLLVRQPNGESARSDLPVSLLDLPATLLSLSGLDPTPFLGVGRDLSPMLGAASPASGRVIVAENDSRAGAEWAGHQRAALRWPLKLIENVDREQRRLFDLAADPGELVDLLPRDSALAEPLATALDTLLVDPTLATTEVLPPDPALLEKLKAMGYVH